MIELAILDAKQGSGPNHHPSGRFFANAAWLVLVCLAHNLQRWIAILGLGAHDEQVVAKNLRRPLLALPGRPAHPHGTPLGAAPARTLAMGALVHHGARQAALHPTPRRLTHPSPSPHHQA